MRAIDLLVVHCSATPNGKDLFQRTPAGEVVLTPVEVIEGWHGYAGFQRHPRAIDRFNPRLQHVGYQFVIYTNGAIATGRALDETGAHAKGYNERSIGICMIGTDRYTQAQWTQLAGLCTSLSKKLGMELVTDVENQVPGASIERRKLRVLGHRDLSADLNRDGAIQPREWIKTCPGFEVAKWFAAGMTPAPEHVL